MTGSPMGPADFQKFGEITPFEGKFNRLNGLVAYGIITNVNNENRSYSVRTIAPEGHPLGDHRQDNIKVLHGSADAAGNEWFFSAPRGTRCVCMAVEGQLYILGFFSPEQKGFRFDRKTDENGVRNQTINNKPDITTGDSVLHNSFGSRFIIRQFGVIEIQSTENCKTFYIPEDDKISTLAQNYTLELSGGTVDWLIDAATRDTNMTAILYDAATPTNIIRIEMGNVDDDLIFKFDTGAPDEDLNIPTTNTSVTIADSGEFNFSVTDVASMKIDIEGNFSESYANNYTSTVGAKATTNSVQDFNVNTDANYDIQALKDALYKCKNFIVNSSANGQLGAGASEPAVLGDTLFSFLELFVEVFNNHAHFHANIISPTPGLTQPPLLQATPPPAAMKSKKWTVE